MPIQCFKLHPLSNFTIDKTSRGTLQHLGSNVKTTNIKYESRYFMHSGPESRCEGEKCLSFKPTFQRH